MSNKEKERHLFGPGSETALTFFLDTVRMAMPIVRHGSIVRARSSSCLVCEEPEIFNKKGERVVRSCKALTITGHNRLQVIFINLIASFAGDPGCLLKICFNLLHGEGATALIADDPNFATSSVLEVEAKHVSWKEIEVPDVRGSWHRHSIRP